MYASKSFNHSTTRTRQDAGVPRETFMARTARRRAIERATDNELRLAVRGTWIELEMPDTTESETDGSNPDRGVKS